MPYWLIAVATPTPKGEKEREGGNSAQFALPIQLFKCVMELKGTFELSPSRSPFFLAQRRGRNPTPQGSLPLTVLCRLARLPLSLLFSAAGRRRESWFTTVRMRNVLRRMAKREAEFMTFATCDSAGGLGYTAGASKHARFS